MATPEELRDSFGVEVPGVWCVTYHLTFFGVFDALLDCTNANVLSQEGLAEIQNLKITRLPAASFFLLVLCLCLLLLFGFAQDRKHGRTGLWRDQFLLLEVLPVTKRSNSKRAAESEQADRSTVNDANSKLQSIQEKIQTKRSLSKMQEHVLVQNTLREASLRHGLTISCIEQHIWGENGWVQGSPSLENSSVLKAMKADMVETLPQVFFAVHGSGLLLLWSTFWSANPIYEVRQCDLHLTAAKRAKINADCILGSLGFVALFFSVDGSAVAARNPSDCPIQQGSALWYVLVAIVSVCLNVVPRSFMYRLARRSFTKRDENVRKQQCQRWCKDMAFWTVSFAFSAFHLLLITAFLANLGEEHEWKWFISFSVVIVRKLLIVPVLACFFSGAITLTAALARPEFRTTPPKKLALDLDLLDEDPSQKQDAAWAEKVEELAMRGITIRQLLDFYATLPSMMPHFDPDESTTHDVVRQAIIPMSLQIWSLRSFVVRVHSAKCSKRGTRSSDGLCVVKVLDKELQHKPWRGGGQTVANEQLVWEEEILLEDVAKQEIIQFGLWMGQESLGEVQLKACVCWQGFYGSLAIKDEETFFCVSVRPYDSVHEARAAMSSSMWIPAPCGARSSSILRSSSRPGLLDSGVDAERLEGLLEVRRFSTSSKLTERRRGEDSKPGFAYATCANGGHGRLAQKMVTHAWGNKFSHLLGAVLADALQDATYDGVSRILKQGDTVSLFNKLQSKGKLDVPYWICALCVNQHAGICARPPPTDSTGHAIAPCECTTAKHFDGALSEMNKFDDMMIFLKRTLRQEARENHSDVQLEQVVAIDVDFNLLTRVWCVAELVAARDLHLHQAVQIHSAARRNSCLDKLQILDVREANASFPADKDLVLSKIDDVDDFNLSLQDLMLHRLQSFLHGNEVRAAANICDDVVLGLLTVVL